MVKSPGEFELGMEKWWLKMNRFFFVLAHFSNVFFVRSTNQFDVFITMPDCSVILNHTKYVTCILYSIRRNLFEKTHILLCSMSRTPNPSFGQTVTNILLNVSNIFNKTLINVRLIRTIKLSNCESHRHLQRHQYFNSHKQKFRKIHKKNGKTVSWARNLYLVGHFMGNQR